MLTTASAVTSTTPQWRYGQRGAEVGVINALRLTPSNALVPAEVQPDNKDHDLRCANEHQIHNQRIQESSPSASTIKIASLDAKANLLIVRPETLRVI